MDKEKVFELLQNVKDDKVSIEDAVIKLKSLPFEDMGFAKIDKHRALRTGYPEVIFCEGKTIDHIINIFTGLRDSHQTILATRASMEIFKAVHKVHSDAVYNELGRTIVIGSQEHKELKGKVLIVTAGTADIPVAEEAAVTAEVMGSSVERLFDAGVAGVHRLFHNVDKLFTAKAIVVAAGMDGALPSIIGGIADVPVIAVPTSIGYGASFNGIAPLLTMLNTCAPGVTVVNIDNGFGAGYMASMINNG